MEGFTLLWVILLLGGFMGCLAFYQLAHLFFRIEKMEQRAHPNHKGSAEQPSKSEQPSV